MKKLSAAAFVLLLIFSTTVSCLAQDLVPVESGSTYTSENFLYTLTIPEEVYIQNNVDSYPDALFLTHKADNFSTIINCDKVDDALIQQMREYINDFESDDEQIFNALVKLKNAQFTALKQYYNNKFLYSNLDNRYESNMKVFGESSENLFGVDSHIALYNTIEYNDLEVKEQHKINITVPVFSNRIIYSFNFRVPKGNLTTSTISSIFRILKSIHIANSQDQTDLPKILGDHEIIEAANMGIYPSIEELPNIKYDTYRNKVMGYELKYPSFFIPYISNRFINSMQYSSFKIDALTTFSVLSEKIQHDNNAIQNKFISLVFTHGKDLNVNWIDKTNINNNKWDYMEYSLTHGGKTTYVTTYSIENNSILYTIKLESKIQAPSQRILKEFRKICKSITFTTPQATQAVLNTYMNKFYDTLKGYSFLFPSNWNLKKMSEPDKAYDLYSLKNPDISSPLDIFIYEDELKSDSEFQDVAKLSNLQPEDYKRYFKSGFMPYDKYIQHSIAGSFFTKDNACYIYKLVNYLDDNGRSRYGYSITVIKGQKAYTMFIALSDYALSDDLPLDYNLVPVINMIAESFFAKG